jgi:hypothetical protein
MNVQQDNNKIYFDASPEEILNMIQSLSKVLVDHGKRGVGNCSIPCNVTYPNSSIGNAGNVIFTVAFI